MKKRMFVSLLAVVFVMMMLPVAALAHGHGGNRAPVKTSDYELCPVADCNLTHLHMHNNSYYAGHNVGDGHSHHQACQEEGCPLIGSHEHYRAAAGVAHNNGVGYGQSKGHGGHGRHH